MTLTREETIERLEQNKAAAEYYAGQSRITAEIENALKDSEAFEMAIEALQDRPKGEWHKTENEEMEITGYYCSVCDMPTDEPTNYCGNCGADMRSEKEYLDKTFPEHDGGEWFDITDMMTGRAKNE